MSGLVEKLAVIHEEGGKFVLKSKDGKKVLGTHDTRDKALAQERAIQASKAGRRKHGEDNPILIPPPPSEEDRLKELRPTLEQYRNRKSPEALQPYLDSKMEALFVELLKKHGIEEKEAELVKISDSLVPIIVRHKEYFDVPRPNELADKHGVEFEFDYLESAQTPSYPSGHTAQAHYVALVLSSRYPELSDDLKKLADRVANSRIDRGVHVPSDNAAGKQLAEEIFRRRLAGKIRKTAAEEFAPGIPKSRKIEPIPKVQSAKWKLSIQEHDAERAGKHWDLRLVDQAKRKAHSWAIPKAKWPGKKNRLRLAIQQPTHTASYALNFEGKIPSGTYGAGNVKIVKNTGTNVKVDDGVVRFSVPRVGNMVLKQTDGNKWLLMRAKKAEDLSAQLKKNTILKTNTLDRLRKLISATEDFKVPKGKHHIKLGPYGYALVRRKKDGSPNIFAVLPGGANPPGRNLADQLPQDRLRKAIKSRWRAGSRSAVARLINILTKKSSYRPSSSDVVGGDSSHYTMTRDQKKDVEEFAPEAVKHTYKPEKGPFGELDKPGGDDFSAR